MASGRLFLTGSFVAAMALIGCQSGNVPPHPSAKVSEPAQAAGGDVLAREVPDMGLQNVTFASALDRLSRAADVEIRVDEAAAIERGARLDKLVNLEWSHVTLGEAMDKLMAAVSTRNAPLAYYVRERVITVTTSAQLAKEAKAHHALQEIAPLTSLHGHSFDSAVEHLRRAWDVEIFVNWRALQLVGVRKDLPITLQWRELTLDEALTALLDQATAPNKSLGYSLDEGVVTISTTDDLSRNVMTRVYDIRAGLSEGARESDLAQIIRRVEGIKPLTWKDQGGNIGSLRELSGQLIVTHTADVQMRIAEELAEYQTQQAFPLVSSNTRHDAQRP